MRPDEQDTSTIELLPISKADFIHSHNDVRSTKRTPIQKWWTFELPALLLVLLAFAPVAILAGLSPRLSTGLGYSGCMPNGDFVLPLNSSIWNPSHFFTITLPFTGRTPQECTSRQGVNSVDQTCVGYSFAAVKAIDIAFDVLVGRGGQAILVWAAYQLFTTVVTSLMERDEVGYDAFATVAFNSGTLSSSGILLRHAVGWTPLPKTGSAMLRYSAMALATLYIVAMPTLFSAMTGYTSHYVPSIQLPNYYFDPATDTYMITSSFNISNDPLTLTDSTSELRMVNCGSSLLPAWGARSGIAANGEGASPIVYNHPPDTANGPDWVDYYHRYYDDVYSKCPVSMNITGCAAANITTYVIECENGDCYHTPVLAPVQGIVTWPDNAPEWYSHWDCAGAIIETSELTQYGGTNATGLCQAGARYAWGFSFSATFGVMILQAIFALLMIALWFDVRNQPTSVKDHGVIKDAVTLVTQAQAQYGDKVGKWSGRTLQTEVVNGRQGMTLNPARRRTGFSQASQDYGDSRSGDWVG